MLAAKAFPKLSHAFKAGSMDMLRHAVMDGESLSEFEKQRGSSSIGEMIISCVRNSSDPPVVSEMLMMGADPNLPCVNGVPPLSFVMIRWPGERIGVTESVLSLLCAGADVNSAIATELAELGWKPQAQSTYSYPLSLAIQLGLFPSIEALLLAGAPVNGPGGDAVLSPLSIAALWEEDAVARLLLARGARAEHCNFDGKTALHFCWSPSLGEILLRHGAPLSQKDHNMNTPLHDWAVRATNIEAIQWLAMRAPNDRYARNNKEDTPLDLLVRRAELATREDAIDRQRLQQVIADWRADILQDQTGQAQRAGGCGRL